MVVVFRSPSVLLKSDGMSIGPSLEQFHRSRGFRIERLFLPQDLPAVLPKSVLSEGPPIRFHAIMLARVDAAAIVTNHTE
jgi:hypothetical protein